ncbi:MAG: class I SAM-dependent methyltransferase [Pseudomonadota bacterium]
MKNPFANLRERWYRRFVHKFYSKDLLLELQNRARADSADYVMSRMAEAIICRGQDELFAYCAKQTNRDGLCLEFGVATGSSIRKLAKLFGGTTIYGFDTFEGLPEDWAGTTESQGKFKREGLPKVPANVQLQQGLFDQTLPAFLVAEHDPVRFIHVDCDLYSSTATIFSNLAKRIVPGTVIVFDEYFNYPNWQAHEFKAFQQYVASHQIQYRYLAFTARGGSVGVLIESVGE